MSLGFGLSGVHVFDIDGTLTKTGHPYWPALSYHFAGVRADELRAIAEAWDKSDKGTGEAFIKTSHEMLEKGIKMFEGDVTGDTLRAKARELTGTFIETGIIRPGAIEFLADCINRGYICILSTGSYEDGAYGFLDALVDKGLLQSSHLERVIVSGAIIDWSSRTVTHANIGSNKIKGLHQKFLEKIGSPLSLDTISGIYVDDPAGNDSGLCELNPTKTYVIETERAIDKAILSAKGHSFFNDWYELGFNDSGFVFFRSRFPDSRLTSSLTFT